MIHRFSFFLRSGKAKVMLSNFKGAHKDLLAAQRIKPNNPSISAELEELYLKQEKCEAQEKFMCQRMFAPQSCSSDKDGMRKTNQEKEKDGETKGKEVEKKKEKDMNQNLAYKVRPEFEALVEENIHNFVNNHKIHELPFPSSLSQEEVVCVATIAKASGLSVMYSQNGTDCSLKIVKKLWFFKGIEGYISVADYINIRDIYGIKKLLWENYCWWLSKDCCCF